MNMRLEESCRGMGFVEVHGMEIMLQGFVGMETSVIGSHTMG